MKPLPRHKRRPKHKRTPAHKRRYNSVGVSKASNQGETSPMIYVFVLAAILIIILI